MNFDQEMDMKYFTAFLVLLMMYQTILAIYFRSVAYLPVFHYLHHLFLSKIYNNKMGKKTWVTIDVLSPSLIIQGRAWPQCLQQHVPQFRAHLSQYLQRGPLKKWRVSCTSILQKMLLLFWRSTKDKTKGTYKGEVRKDPCNIPSFYNKF